MTDNSIPKDSTDRTDALPAVPADETFPFGAHHTSPSTAGLYDELRSELDRSVVDQTMVDQNVTEREQPPYVAGTIDVSEFLKALASFNLEQSSFLRGQRTEDNDQYLRLLVRYSLAQDDYIRAMSVVLHQLGVI